MENIIYRNTEHGLECRKHPHDEQFIAAGIEIEVHGELLADAGADNRCGKEFRGLFIVQA
ncbi:MAG: hypothetical protein ABIK28_01350 [Planctomycetota bacterium]